MGCIQIDWNPLESIEILVKCRIRRIVLFLVGNFTFDHDRFRDKHCNLDNNGWYLCMNPYNKARTRMGKI